MNISDGDTFTYTLKQPVGVCGLILPWNAPVAMFASKVVTALAAGMYKNFLRKSPTISLILLHFNNKIDEILEADILLILQM